MNFKRNTDILSMKLTFYFLLLTGLTRAHAQGTWQLLPEAPEEELWFTRYDDIFFINDSVGFAGGTEGEILFLTHYGDSIESVYEGDEVIRAIEFLDDNIGFAGTLHGKSFLKTADGGNSWVDIGENIPHEIIQVCGLANAEGTLYAVGRWAGPAYVFKSEDLGEEWEVFDLSVISNGLTDAHFFTPNHGFVVGNSIYDSLGGAIFETQDGGLTWETVHTTNTIGDFVWKIQFINDSIGFGSVQDFPGNPNRILKTVDGGKSWTTLVVSEADTSNFNFQGVGFVNDTLGWVGGWGEGIFQTIDGGTSWELLPIGSNYNRFFPITPNLVYASGNRLYRYTDSLNLSTGPNEEVLNIDLNTHRRAVLQTYPNPVGGELHIKVGLLNRTFVDLRLYSVKGSTIEVISRGQLEAGMYSYDLDLSTFGTGIFFIGLKTSEGYYFKKIIKE